MMTTTSTMSNTKNPTLAQAMKLFRTAGLLLEKDWAAFVQKHQKNKHIVDVLQQDVAVGTFVDLFTADIGFTSRKKREKSELHRSLMSSGLIQDRELLELLNRNRPPAELLIAPMLEDNVVDEAAADRIRSILGDENNPDPWLLLVSDGLLSASLITDWFADIDGQLVRRVSLFQALQCLNQNGLIDNERVDLMTGLLDDNKAAEVCAQIHETLGLTSGRLAELINDGINPPRVNIDTTPIDAHLFELLPQSMLRRQIIAPFYEDPRVLGLATTDPFHMPFAGLVHWITGRWAMLAFAPGRLIIDRVNDHFGSPIEGQGGSTPATAPHLPNSPQTGETGPGRHANSGAEGAGAKAPGGKSKSKPPTKEQSDAMRRADTGTLTQVSDTTSAVQLVTSLIESAMDLRTTDIHLEAARDGLNVRFRIDGELHRIMTIPATLASPVVSRIKVMADMDVTERRRPQDGHFELKLGRRNVDFRISTLPAILGEKIVIRILDTTRVMTGLEDLGMLREQYEQMERILQRTNGMLLVSGPTGSGKTSTLYSALNKLNAENRNLITIEDPVEYQIAGINQVQVDNSIDMGFYEGLRSILRQDPDIIMVGEIRDPDTAYIALRAAMTGHLVLSTIHTNSATGTFDALRQLKASSFIISAAVIGIISQRLVRSLCLDCRKGKMVDDEQRKLMGLEAGVRKRIYRAVGCEKCLGSGYIGRTGIFEVIRVDETIRGLIATDAALKDVETHIRESGVLSLGGAGSRKVMAGETSFDEVNRKILLDL